MDFIRSTVDQAQKHPSDTLTGGMTGTIYRKKRNTVEFTPGKKPQTAPPPQPVPQRSGEPVGEPIEVPRSQPVPSGFTMQIGGLDTVPTDSTQEFMSAYNAVRPQRRQAAAQPRPMPRPAAQDPAPQPDAAGEDPYENTVVVGDATQEENRQTGELLLPHRQRDDVDQLVDTLTGRISLTPQPSAAPAHTGFTQSLSAPAPAHSGFTQNLSSVAAAPARTGFTQQLGGVPVPAQSSHSGYTQNLGAAPAEPNTSAFVSAVANAITSGAPAGDTQRYEDAAARLTASLAEDAATARTHTHIPTAAEVRQAAARFAGRAEDESEDNAVSPFETAEIPVPHSREYERAEDAPAVRAELA